jgi:glycosyltransferase involved in cell wall biosynthesis
MRVAWLCPYPIFRLPPFSGRGLDKSIHPATWLVTLSAALVREARGIELHVVSESLHAPARTVCTHEGITFHVLPSPPVLSRGGALPRLRVNNLLSLNLANRGRLLGEIRAIDPDVVHGHGTERACGLTAVSCGVPSVVSIQGILSEILRHERSPSALLRKALERWTVRHGRVFVVKSPFAEAFVRGLNPTCRTELIENPVHPAFFSVRRLHVESPRFLFVGTVTREKGVEELLRAAAAAGKVLVSLVGEGPAETVQGFRNLARSLQIDDRVEFLGSRSPEEVASLLGSSTALVLPSHMETSPNVVMEALCAGIPAIATDVGGIPSLVADGRNGLLVRTGDVAGLSAAMRRVARDPALRESLGEAGRSEGQRRFQSAGAVRRLVGLYEEVRRGRGTRQGGGRA